MNEIANQTVIEDVKLLAAALKEPRIPIVELDRLLKIRNSHALHYKNIQSDETKEVIIGEIRYINDRIALLLGIKVV